MPYRNTIGAGIVALLLSAGCQAPEDTRARPAEPKTAEAPVALTTDQHRLNWGDLTQKPGGFEQQAEGPSSVAVTPNGTTLVLDRLGGAIVAVDPEGKTHKLAPVDEDVEDIAVGPDGAIVAYSPLRARAWIFEDDGSPAGEVSIPRTFREITNVGLDGSRMVRLRTFHQETYTVGSPNAPLALPVAMRTKKEGSYQLADGTGVATLAKDGHAVLTLVRQATEGNKAELVAKHTIAGEITAARVVGVSGEIACMRTEHVTSTPKISVSRRAVCMNVATGEVTLDTALPAPGNYTPRRELAVGAGMLAFIHPTPDGLTVSRWKISKTEVAR